MTALEQQLTKALRALSAQYEQAQRQHAAQVETLQQQVEALERQVAQLDGASDALGPGLQDARRDVARTLDLMRQRVRERDHGPSR